MARVDWESVLNDIMREGMTIASIARKLNTTPSRISGWKHRGYEPNHYIGELLIAIWAKMKEAPVSDVPRYNSKKGSSGNGITQ